MICPNCSGDLYDSSELARAHAELLEAGRSVSVSCSYCGSVQVRRPMASRDAHAGTDRYPGDRRAPRSEVQGAYAPPGPADGFAERQAGRGAGPRLHRHWNRDGERRVSPLLGIGIFVFPYIFAWFTLQPTIFTSCRRQHSP